MPVGNYNQKINFNAGIEHSSENERLRISAVAFLLCKREYFDLTKLI